MHFKKKEKEKQPGEVVWTIWAAFCFSVNRKNNDAWLSLTGDKEEHLLAVAMEVITGDNVHLIGL